MSNIVPGDAPPPREHIEYNKLFWILVSNAPDDESPLIGFVSYVFYKISKREFVDNFYRLNHRHPNEPEMRAYIASWTDSRIDGLKTEAATTLSDFSSFIIDNERARILKEALKHRSFWRDAAVAGFGAFLYTVVLVGITIALKFAGIDVLHIAAQAK